MSGLPTNPDDLVWIEPGPPQAHTGGSDYTAIADALRARPGEWAMLTDQGANSTASGINRGKYVAFRPAEAWEATSRSNGPDTKQVRIFVRYVGVKKESAASVIAASLRPLVRQWANENGYEIAERGRIPQHIVTEYLDARTRGTAFDGED